MSFPDPESRDGGLTVSFVSAVIKVGVAEPCSLTVFALWTISEFSHSQFYELRVVSLKRVT